MIEDLISGADFNNLKSDNIINIQIMKEDFKLSEKDISVLLDNVFTLYDAGIKLYKVAPDKHGAFLLLTMHKYYDFIVDYMAQTRNKYEGNVEFHPNKIKEENSRAYVKVLYGGKNGQETGRKTK